MNVKYLSNKMETSSISDYDKTKWAKIKILTFSAVKLKLYASVHIVLMPWKTLLINA